MNKDVEKITSRVIKSNIELQALILNAMSSIQLTFNETYKDKSKHSEYLNDWNKKALNTFYGACYEVLRSTTDTISDLNESEDN